MNTKITSISLFFLLLMLSPGNLDAQTWPFDNTMEPWQIVNDNGVAELSDFISVFDVPSQGVRLSMNEFGDSVEFVNTAPIQIEGSEGLIFRIKTPNNLSNIEAIELYAFYKDTLGSDSTFTALERYEVGQFPGIDYHLEIPENDSLLEIGLRIIGKTSIGSPDFFIDYISYDSDIDRFFDDDATVDPVIDIDLDSVGTTFAGISWLAATGTDLKHYLIWRRNQSDYSEVFIDSTTNTFYIDHDVLSNTSYDYYVYSVDQMGRIPESYRFVRAVIPSFPEDMTWDFESGLGGWSTIGGETTHIDSISYSGFYSAGLIMDSDTNKISFYEEEFIPESEQTIFFRFKVPEDISDLDVVGPFAAYDSGSVFMVNALEDDGLIPGEWMTTTLKIPDYESFESFGFQVQSETNGAPAVYVDLVSTNPQETGVPTIQPPTGLQADTVGHTYFSYSWNPSLGNGSRRYVSTVYRTFSNPFIPIIARVSEIFENRLSFKDLTNRYWQIELFAKDQFDRETETISIPVELIPFDSHATFDFETGFEGWSGTEGALSLTTSNSISGSHSIEFTTQDPESYLEFISSDSVWSVLETGKVLPGHILHYRLWVSSEEAAKIETFKFWVKDQDLNKVFVDSSIKSIHPDEWTTFLFTIPDMIEEIHSFGFTVLGREEGINPEATLFVDLISTVNSPSYLPRLTIPSNVQVEANGFSYELTWSPSMGRDELKQYNIYRRLDEGEESGDFVNIGSTSDTLFTETIFGSAKFEFRVTAVNKDDLESLFSESVFATIGNPVSTEPPGELPEVFKLFNNYPNPFNPSTQIRYDLPEHSAVKIQVFTINGQLVQTLVNEVKPAGKHTATFRAADLASGMYIYRMEAGDFVQVQRMLLIK